MKSFDTFEATMHATTKSVAVMEVLKSYWDTPGSPAEEEIQPAAQPVLMDVAPFDGSVGYPHADLEPQGTGPLCTYCR